MNGSNVYRAKAFELLSLAESVKIRSGGQTRCDLPDIG